MQALPFDPEERWRMCVDRSNPALLASANGEIARALYTVVLALDRRYGPGRKSPDALTQRFVVAPPEFAARVQASFGMPPSEQAAALEQLIRETYDLIEKEARPLAPRVSERSSPSSEPRSARTHPSVRAATVSRGTKPFNPVQRGRKGAT